MRLGTDYGTEEATDVVRGPWCTDATDDDVGFLSTTGVGGFFLTTTGVGGFYYFCNISISLAKAPSFCLSSSSSYAFLSLANSASSSALYCAFLASRASLRICSF